MECCDTDGKTIVEDSLTDEETEVDEEDAFGAGGNLGFLFDNVDDEQWG